MLLSIIAANLAFAGQELAVQDAPEQDSEELICIVGNPEVMGRMEMLRTEIAEIGVELEKLERIHEQAKRNAASRAKDHRRFSQDAYTKSSREVNSALAHSPGTRYGRERGMGVDSSREHSVAMARRFNKQVEIREAKVAEFRELETQIRREARPCEG